MISEQKMLFVVGAQKAGTTWLRKKLFALNDYSLGPIKELHYYSQFSDVDKFDWCASHRLEQFMSSGVSSGVDALTLKELNSLGSLSEASYKNLLSFDLDKILCDFSPEYCLLEANVLEKMMEDFPNSRFVYILRDPVARALSQVRMQSIDIFDLQHLLDIESHSHIVSQSKYIDNINRILSVVPKDKFLVLNYDDISVRPATFLNRVHFFTSGNEIPVGLFSDLDLQDVVFSFSHLVIPNQERVTGYLNDLLAEDVSIWKSLTCSL